MKVAVASQHYAATLVEMLGIQSSSIQHRSLKYCAETDTIYQFWAKLRAGQHLKPDDVADTTDAEGNVIYGAGRWVPDHLAYLGLTSYVDGGYDFVSNGDVEITGTRYRDTNPIFSLFGSAKMTNSIEQYVGIDGSDWFIVDSTPTNPMKAVAYKEKDLCQVRGNCLGEYQSTGDAWLKIIELNNGVETTLTADFQISDTNGAWKTLIFMTDHSPTKPTSGINHYRLMIKPAAGVIVDLLGVVCSMDVVEKKK